MINYSTMTEQGKVLYTYVLCWRLLRLCIHSLSLSLQLMTMRWPYLESQPQRSPLTKANPKWGKRAKHSSVMTFSSNTLFKEQHFVHLVQNTWGWECRFQYFFNFLFLYGYKALITLYWSWEDSYWSTKKILPYKLNPLSPFPHSCFVPKTPLLSWE